MTRRELVGMVLNYLGAKVSCQDAAEAMTDYLEGTLGVVRRVRFEMHLGICVGCRVYLRQMKQTIQTLGALPDEPIPAPIREKLLERFRTWTTKKTD